MHRHFNAKQLERMEPSIVLLKNALEVNSIYNVDFEAIKQSFGYVTNAQMSICTITPRMRIEKYANDQGRQMFSARIKKLSDLYTASVKDFL